MLLSTCSNCIDSVDARHVAGWWVIKPSSLRIGRNTAHFYLISPSKLAQSPHTYAYTEVGITPFISIIAGRWMMRRVHFSIIVTRLPVL